MKDIKYTIMLRYKMTVQLEYIDRSLNFPQKAKNGEFTFCVTCTVQVH